jgi:hypothetical protein
MINLNAGIYDIDSEQVHSLLNLHADALLPVAWGYSKNRDYAAWIKNPETDELTIFTGNPDKNNIRTAITGLIGS